MILHSRNFSERTSVGEESVYALSEFKGVNIVLLRKEGWCPV